MMTHYSLAFVVAAIFAGSNSLFAEATNKFSVRDLAQRHLPDCRLRVDRTGKVEAVVSPTGEVLEIATSARDHPNPTNGVAGYWFTPTMDFLSKQKPRASTSQEAVGVVQLMHSLWRGPDFIQQKLYAARAFDGGWVVQVEHDFANYPSSFP